MIRRRASRYAALERLARCATLASVLAIGPAACAAQPDGDHAAPSPPGAVQPAGSHRATSRPALEHITIGPQHRWIDIDAEVILREADWIELLASSRGTREHESVLVVDARPSHIHLALIFVGAAPGTPLTWKKADDGYESQPPRGQRVAVTLIYEHDDKRVEVPAHQWVVNQHTNEPLPDNHWLFAGSTLHTHEDQTIYMADLNGTVVSLVNFGDDVLARATDVTHNNDDGMWSAVTDRIPPVGTKVTIRLIPVRDEQAKYPNTQVPNDEAMTNQE